MKFKIIYLLPLIIIISIIEMYARIKNPSWNELDKILGWKLKRNFNHTYNQIDAYGKKYKATISTDENRFRRFVEKNDKKKIKILVIGDSFVADPYVSDSKMWYSVMAADLNREIKNLNFDVYATGGGGYGTVQEFLLLKKILKKFEPDIFILNFCSNDFRNNSYDIEKNGSAINQVWRRPYVDINENIFYEKKFLAKISRIPIIGDSKIFNKVIFLIGLKMKIKVPELLDEKSKMDEAIKITDIYLKKISKLFNNKKIFICNCSDEKDYMNQNWIKIGAKNGFIPLAEANKAINNSIKKKEEIFYYDMGHYNEKGNEIYGKAIAKEIYTYLKDYLIAQ